MKKKIKCASLISIKSVLQIKLDHLMETEILYNDNIIELTLKNQILETHIMFHYHSK